MPVNDDLDQRQPEWLQVQALDAHADCIDRIAAIQSQIETNDIVHNARLLDVQATLDRLKDDLETLAIQPQRHGRSPLVSLLWFTLRQASGAAFLGFGYLTIALLVVAQVAPAARQLWWSDRAAEAALVSAGGLCLLVLTNKH
jgi:hypothetical protein